MTAQQPTPLEHDVTDGLGDVQRMLTESSPEALLKAFASLTHRMHGATPSTEHVRRMERDLVEAELLRRLRGVRAEQAGPVLPPTGRQGRPAGVARHPGPAACC